MADFQESLPVLTQNDGDIVAKICDATTESQQLAVDANGRISVNINDISAGTQTNDVKVTLDSEAVVLGAGSATIGKVYITDGTDDLAISASGAISIDDISSGTQTNDVKVTLDGESVSVTGTVTVSGTIDIGDISSGTQTNDVKVTLDGEAVSIASGQSIQITDGTDTLAVNTDGSINVNIVSAAVSGEVHDYNTAAAVAAAGTSNHDVTVTATKTFLLRGIIVAASGRFKAELQVGPVASLATKAVAFGTGANGSNVILNFDPPIEIPDTSTGTIRIIRTNRAPQAQDLYSTIIGYEV